MYIKKSLKTNPYCNNIRESKNFAGFQAWLELSASVMYNKQSARARMINLNQM